MSLFSDKNALSNYITMMYKGNVQEWFLEEVGSPDQVYQINKVKEQKSYLNGSHKVLSRPDFKYKNAEFTSRKLVINLMNTIVNFHTAFMVGNRLKIMGDETRTKIYDDIYKNADYDEIDYQIVRDLIAHGNAFEYVYIDDDGSIKSHIISPDTGYPVYDDNGRYLAFIEFYSVEDRGYYTVYYEEKVEQWTNADITQPKPTLQLVGTYNNETSLPLVYKTYNNVNPLRGRAIMEDVKPLLDELEDTMSKLGDSVNTWVINPMPVVIGQRIENNIPTSAMGVVMNLEDGADFKFPAVQLDTNTVQFYLDNIKKHIFDMANVPRIIFETASISNVSTDSLRFFYQNAVIFANNVMRNSKGTFRDRFKLFDKIKNITINDSFDLEFDLTLPASDKELLDNLKTQYEMGAISIRTIIEQSPYTSDQSESELRRLNEQTNTETNNIVTDNLNQNPIDGNIIRDTSAINLI